MSNNLVAVYGTLKRNEGNHSIMQKSDSSYVGTTITEDRYDLHDGWGYPRVVFDGNTSKIQVEVFNVKNLEPMDRLEGHPTFFERKQIKVVGIEEPVWMYFHPPISNKTSVLEGDIVNWTGRNV